MESYRICWSLSKMIFLGEFKDLVEQKSRHSVLIVQLLSVQSLYY